VVVPTASPVKSLADLEGRRLGVAGSGIDKSWLLLQAYAHRTLGLDLAAKATIQFGAAPLLTEQLRSGSLDAMLNFWTQNVRLPSAEFRELLAMKDVLAGLDVDPAPAFVGFIWKEPLEGANAGAVGLFLTAVAEANAVLASSDAAWERLRPLLKAQSDAEAAAIRSAYRTGIAPPWGASETRSAEALMQLLISAGDQELIGAKTRFDPKLFHVAST
jgi:NitT/TauT family transport system substrate-binding protein